MRTHIPRHVKPRVLEALGDTRIVVLQGARQVGKTTLLREIIVEREGKFVSFDDETTRQDAAADPVGFLQQFSNTMLAIDEVQRVPSIILALKLTVDQNPQPGRFLLSGSADLFRLPATEDSLAGRVESIDLHGFSQGEISGHRETFTDRLFEGESFLQNNSSLHRHDYLERAVVGSYPEAVARPSDRRRNQWLDNYLTQIVNRDAVDIVDTRRVEDLPRLLRVVASRNAEELNLTDIAAASEIPRSTLTRQMDLLETLYLTHRVPAWSRNVSQRTVSRPKVSLLDSGLAARLTHLSAAGAAPAANPERAGNLLEGFVAAELRKQSTWAEIPFRIYHYRDRAGAEVDLVLETPDGRIAGIEVKASAAPRGKDARWLSELREKLGARFIGGLILHTGQRSGSRGERITACPIDVLWS